MTIATDLFAQQSVPKPAITSHLKNKGLASTGIEASPSVEQGGA